MALNITAVLTIIFFIAVANPWGLYFLNDDFIHIPLAAAGNFFHSNLLRPVADFSLWLDYAVWGKDSFGFHLTNVMIHLLNAFLAYNLYVKIFAHRKKGNSGAMAVFAALLFLVYAFHSESLFWIIGRGGSLAALFMLISLNCYAWSKSNLSLIISLISFFVGLFAYEFVWILPVIIFLFQGWDFYNKKALVWRWSIGFAAVFVIYLLIRSQIGGVFFSNYEIGSFREGSLVKLATNYSATMARSFIPPVHNTAIFVGAAGLALVAAIAATGYLIRKRKADITYLILPFLCLLTSCVPSVSLGIDTHDTEGERFLYVPSIFCCWFLAELIFTLFTGLRTRFLMLLIVLLFHCYYLCTSAKDYRYAGMVVKHSLECIASSPGADTLIVKDLPSQYRGALIFRTGFENSLAWMIPGKFQNIKILSYQELNEQVKYNCAPSPVEGHSAAVAVRWSPDGDIDFSETIR